MLTLIWDSLLAFIALWSLGASAVAKWDAFRPWPLLGVTIVAGLISASVWGRRLRRCAFSPREALVLLTLICLGAGLLGQPAEHYPLVSESSIYPNTAVVLSRTGSFHTTFTPFEGLTEAQKLLFYLPVSRQAGVTPRSYQGMVNGVFYVMDAPTNTIVASRQPVAPVWMGLAVLLFGPQASMAVAPIFGILGVVALYFWGKRVFNARVGALAALLLLVSFPQLYFSRTPYSEIFGQVFMAGALYAWTSYLRLRERRYLALGSLAYAAAFSARIDSILALGTVGFLLVLLLWERDRQGLLAGILGLLAAVGLSVALWNFPYVHATYELLLYSQLQLLRDLPLLMLVGTGVLLGGSVALLIWFREAVMARVAGVQWRRRQVARVGLPAFRWGAAVGLLLLVAYALFIRPLNAEFIQVDGQWYRTYDEELLAVAAQYLSSALICLAALGLAWTIERRHPHAAQLLTAVFVLSFSLIMFWKYTTGARVYPVALRRMVTDVFPGICLMGAVAVDGLRRLRWRWSRSVATALAGGLVVALLLVWPNYWFYHEGAGTWTALQEMRAAIPENAIVLFEPQEEERIVSWFATPLWTFEQRQTLVLNPWFASDLEALEQAFCTWQSMGREVYLMAQRDPAVWWPSTALTPEAVQHLTWNSSLVGHTREFPPTFWRFAFEFQLYRLRGSCVH